MHVGPVFDREQFGDSIRKNHPKLDETTLVAGGEQRAIRTVFKGGDGAAVTEEFSSVGAGRPWFA